MAVTLSIAWINFRRRIVPEITKMGRYNGDWHSAVVSNDVDLGQLRRGCETPDALSRANNRFRDLPDSIGTTDMGRVSACAASTAFTSGSSSGTEVSASGSLSRSSTLNTVKRFRKVIRCVWRSSSRAHLASSFGMKRSA